MKSQVIHGNCFDILPTLPDKSVFSVITDPPYGIKLDTWDVPVDIPVFTAHAARLSTGFYCFFGQMPTMLNWANEATKVMQYKDHISWVKRTVTQTNGLFRTHESICIYKQKNTHYYNIKGKYEDVKLPGILFDVITIEAFRAYSEDLRGRLKGTVNFSPENRSKRQQDAFKKRFSISNKEIGFRSPEFVNYTNVWSFLPSTHLTYGKSKIKFQHPTQKPLELMKRLVELTTPADGIVLDPFAGSGTTAIACLETGRRYICIEQNPEYHQMILDRIEAWHQDNQTQQQELNLGE